MPPVGTLQTRGLRKSYGDVVAVEALDIDVAAGTVLGFLGPNGAGKTTVIRMLSTVLTPDAGSFTVAGIPHTHPDGVRRHLGVLPESAGYPNGQTGEEWLTFHGRLFGRSRPDARSVARRLLDRVGLAEQGRSRIATYSRGMRQRLGIARALVNDPAVVFLDEPTLGLDPSGQLQILELVARIAREQGVTVLLSTHLLAEVEQVCDRVLILNHGQVVADGTVAEVVRRAASARRGVVEVAPRLRDRALELLKAEQLDVAAAGDDRHGQIQLTVSGGTPVDRAATVALTCLLRADIPVLGFSIEGGRLSDAFLAVTGGGTDG